MTPAQANFYRLLRLALSPAVKDAFQMHVEGAYHLPRRGGALVVCNHRSFVDPFLLGTAIRRPINFLAASFVFKVPVFARLAERTGAIPVNISGGKNAQPALQEAVRCLQQGQIVGIFPEGVASFRKGAEGVARFQMGFIKALAAAGIQDLPVIPCAIAGEGERTLAELPPALMRLIDPSDKFAGGATEIRVPQRAWVGIGKPMILGQLLGDDPDQERMRAASEAVRAEVHHLYEYGQQALDGALAKPGQLLFGLGPVQVRVGRRPSRRGPSTLPDLAQGENLIASYPGRWGDGHGDDWLLVSDQKLTFWHPPETAMALTWEQIAEVRADGHATGGTLSVLDRHGRRHPFRFSDDTGLAAAQAAIAQAMRTMATAQQTEVELALWDPDQR